MYFFSRAQVSGKHSESLRKLNASVVFSTAVARENVTTTSSLNATADSIFHEPFDHYYYVYTYTGKLFEFALVEKSKLQLVFLCLTAVPLRLE